MNAALRHPIVCVEGLNSPSPRWLTAASLAAHWNGINLPFAQRFLSDSRLSDERFPFRKPKTSEWPPLWAVELLTEVWSEADNAAREGKRAVLDTDPFWPLWCRWIYAETFGGQTPEQLRDFYRPRLLSGALRFPDVYLFYTHDYAVRLRTESSFLAQERYFQTMAKLAPRRVVFLDESEMFWNEKRVVDFAVAHAPRFTSSPERDVALFDALNEWLATYGPESEKDFQ